ncbi:MAG: DUF3536 domain-containing protein [Candidatus Margulisiibacteriota bacterium]
MIRNVRTLARREAFGNPRNIAFHLNTHNPLRAVFSLRPPHTLITIPFPELSATRQPGPTNANWTDVCYHQSYSSLMARGPKESAYRYSTYSFTPALVRQLEFIDPKFLRQLKAADDLSAHDLKGRGGAIASGFDHTILPLGINIDRAIQIKWSIEHFKHTFGRKPEGFWAPEAAVSNEVMSSLANNGIKFTILSPWQVETINGEPPLRTGEGSPVIDFGIPYKIATRDGKVIHAFVYNRYLSQELAFTDFLESGDGNRLATRLNEHLMCNAAIACALDTETLGLHKRGGVATYLDYLSKAAQYNHRPVNFAFLLDQTLSSGIPIPTLGIKSPSSWSCEHGVERWRSDCRCPDNTDNPWRTAFREALNFLAERADSIFCKTTERLISDQEGAKLRYIDVLLGKKTFDTFISEETGGKRLTKKTLNELSAVFDGLVPRQGMFVSCGWFFHGMGLETGICLGQAADLIARLEDLASGLEEEFLCKLGGIYNSAGFRERGQCETAADQYNLTKQEQAYWAQRISAL